MEVFHIGPRKAGNRVRITVQLIEAETNRHVWAERYDRDLDDVFALQDENRPYHCRPIRRSRRCLELRPGFTVEEFDRESPYQPEDRERWLDGLRKAGLPI